MASTGSAAGLGSLSKFPPEIRIQVWKWCVAEPEFSPSSLALASRRICDEVYPVMYSASSMAIGIGYNMDADEVDPRRDTPVLFVKVTLELMTASGPSERWNEYKELGALDDQSINHLRDFPLHLVPVLSLTLSLHPACGTPLGLRADVSLVQWVAGLVGAASVCPQLRLTIGPPRGGSWDANSTSKAEQTQVRLADPVSSWPDVAKTLAVLTQVPQLQFARLEFWWTSPALQLYHQLAAWLTTPSDARAAHEEFRDLRHELDECHQLISAEAEAQQESQDQIFLQYMNNF